MSLRRALAGALGAVLIALSPGFGAYEACAQVLRAPVLESGVPLPAPALPPTLSQEARESLSAVPGSAFGLSPDASETLSSSIGEASEAAAAPRGLPALHAARAAVVRPVKAPLGLRARIAAGRPLPLALASAAAAELPLFVLSSLGWNGSTWAWFALAGAAVAALGLGMKEAEDAWFINLALASAFIAVAGVRIGWGPAAYVAAAAGVGLCLTPTIRERRLALFGHQLKAVREQAPLSPTAKQAEWLARLGGPAAERLAVAMEARREPSQAAGFARALALWGWFERDKASAAELALGFAERNDRAQLVKFAKGPVPISHFAGKELENLRAIDEAAPVPAAPEGRAEAFELSSWPQLRAKAEAMAEAVAEDAFVGKARERAIREAIGNVDAALRRGDREAASVELERLMKGLRAGGFAFGPGALPALHAAPSAAPTFFFPDWRHVLLWLGAAAVGAGRLALAMQGGMHFLALAALLGLASGAAVCAFSLFMRDGTHRPLIAFLAGFLPVTMMIHSSVPGWAAVPVAFLQAAALHPLVSQRFGLLRVSLKRRLSAALPFQDPAFDRRLLQPGRARLKALGELLHRQGAEPYIQGLTLLANEDPWLPNEKVAVETLGRLALRSDEAMKALPEISGRHPAISSAAGLAHLDAISRRLELAKEAPAVSLPAGDGAARTALERARAELSAPEGGSFVERARRAALEEAAVSAEDALARKDDGALAVALKRLEGLLAGLGLGFGSKKPSSGLRIFLTRPEVLAIPLTIAAVGGLFLGAWSVPALAASKWPSYVFFLSVFLLWISKKGTRGARLIAYTFLASLTVWLSTSTARLGMWPLGLFCAVFINLRFTPIILRNYLGHLPWGKWKQLQAWADRSGAPASADWAARLGGRPKERLRVVREMAASPDASRGMRDAAHYLFYLEEDGAVKTAVLDLFAAWKDQAWLKDAASKGDGWAASASRRLAELEEAERQAEAVRRLAERAAELTRPEAVEAAAARGRAALVQLSGEGLLGMARTQAVREALDEVERAGAEQDANRTAIAARRLDELISTLGLGFGAWARAGTNALRAFGARLAGAAVGLGAAAFVAANGYPAGVAWTFLALVGSLMALKKVLWSVEGPAQNWWWGALAAGGFAAAMLLGPLGAYYDSASPSLLPLFFTLGVMNAVIGAAAAQVWVQKRGLDGLPKGDFFPRRPERLLAALVSSDRFVKWWLQSSWVLGLGLWSFIYWKAAAVGFTLFITGLAWVFAQGRLKRWLGRTEPPEAPHKLARKTFDSLPPSSRERLPGVLEASVSRLSPAPTADHPFLLLISDRSDVRQAAWQAAMPEVGGTAATAPAAADLLAAVLEHHARRSADPVRPEEYRLLAGLGRPGVARLLGLARLPQPDAKRLAIDALGPRLELVSDEELEALDASGAFAYAGAAQAFGDALLLRRKAKVPVPAWDQRAASAIERARAALAVSEGATFAARLRLEALRGLADGAERALSAGEPGALEVSVLRLETALDELPSS